MSLAVPICSYNCSQKLAEEYLTNARAHSQTDSSDAQHHPLHLGLAATASWIEMAGFICKMRRSIDGRDLIRLDPVFTLFHFWLRCLSLPSSSAPLSFLHSHSKMIAAPIRLTPRSSLGKEAHRRPSSSSSVSSLSSGLDGIREGICRCCRQLVKRLKCYISHARVPMSFWFCFSA